MQNILKSCYLQILFHWMTERTRDNKFLTGYHGCVLSYSVLSNFMIPWTIAYQAPLSIFSRQEYCSELSFPSPEDLPNPGFELISVASPALVGWFFTTEPLGKTQWATSWCLLAWKTFLVSKLVVVYNKKPKSINIICMELAVYVER